VTSRWDGLHSHLTLGSFPWLIRMLQSVAQLAGLHVSRGEPADHSALLPWHVAAGRKTPKCCPTWNCFTGDPRMPLYNSTAADNRAQRDGNAPRA
jgi:hypothetical protein